MAAKDTVMMILAFLGGLILVTIIFGGGTPQKTDNAQDKLQTPLDISNNYGQMVELGNGYFVYHSPEDRFFLCRFDKGRLEVVDVYNLTHKPSTFHAGVEGETLHGWAFESMSREKEAILEAKCKQFSAAVLSQDWNKSSALANEIAGVGGTDFLCDWLKPDCDWCGRRAAALALGQRGYIITVPHLADMLLEGDEIRAKATELLIKLTGEDYSAFEDRQKIIRAYKKWHDERVNNKE